MATVTDLLSRYPILQGVCQNLTSADVIHLAATSKTHWVHLASSASTLKLLNANALCDGTGIIAQARVFYHWKGDVSSATYHCLGTEGKPCSKCGAKVCNNCRFHITYDNVSDWDFSDDDPEGIVDTWDDLDRTLGNYVYSADDGRPPLPAEKAFRIHHSAIHICCSPCSTRLAEPRECKCNVYEYFVGRRWLCLPCFFVEEAEAVAIKQRVVYSKDLGESYPLTQRAPEIYKVPICSCGSPIERPSRYEGDEITSGGYKFRCQRCDGRVRDPTDVGWDL